MSKSGRVRFLHGVLSLSEFWWVGRVWFIAPASKAGGPFYGPACSNPAPTAFRLSLLVSEFHGRVPWLVLAFDLRGLDAIGGRALARPLFICRMTELG